MLQTIITRRNITDIYHFTKMSNLHSILQNGILPRNFLEYNEINFSFNDQVRADNRVDCSSFSISHPNYKMFYPCRLNDPNSDWVVLSFDPSIILEKNVFFYPTNAASNTERFRPAIEHQGNVAFEAMFAERNGLPTRTIRGLKDNEPSDVQAEIMIEGLIESRYITNIYIDSIAKIKCLDNIKRIAQQNPTFKFYHYSDLFYPRHDYNYLR